LALAILFHKATDTFALAVTLVRYGVSRTKIVGATVILSLASPVGALLASMADLSGPHLLHGILAATTAGTFLYLAGSDLLVPELKDKEGRGVKIVAAMVGFSIVTLAILKGS
jgi:zinc transporter ZupT